MLKIVKLTTENLSKDCVTDNRNPRFAFSLESERKGVFLEHALFTIGSYTCKTESQSLEYLGEPLKPFTEYTVNVIAVDNYGDEATASMKFKTGRLNAAWQADFITDTDYKFTAKKVSPKPMTFRKKLKLDKQIKLAELYVTAIGIYELQINGEKVGKDYFAPGFTSYKNQLQYQSYNVTEMLTGNDTIQAVLSGGWAVGKFTHSLRNRIFAKRQALLCELRVEYTDGTTQIIGTDKSWQVSLDGNFKETDFYDGEIYDASVNLDSILWKNAGVETLKLKPNILCTYGALVRAHEEFTPVSITLSKSGSIIYDFGQNFAGVIKAKIKGKKGQSIIFRHAEVLKNGELFTEPLRTAKARAIYICKGETEEVYSPTLTYMGFRYVSVEGINREDLELSAVALYSDIEQNGSFTCSNEMINKLQSNIVWSAKSNFVDIPTDCPQRDERLGWTGDIAMFASTAAFNFDTSRFLDKWLKDLQTDQKRTGGVPVTIPHVAIPSNLESVFVMAIDHWGDSCILVPWAEYLARGNKNLLRKMYPSMQKYLKACKFWAGLFSVGKYRKIWKIGHHYGDWCAPNIGLWGWMGRGKWTATACLANSCNIVSKIADLLGMSEDCAKYKKLSEQIADAYKSVFTDKLGKLKNEFQTAYVLPLYYGIFSGEEKAKAAKNLVDLIKKNYYNIGTGFPGTPYVLFALADNGYQEDAYKMLLNETCPSWMHEIKAGGTTLWERWDALRGDGTSNTGASDGTHGMISFNHYANGAVGDFFYRRISGIESLDSGYKTFKIQPLLGGAIAFAKAEVETAYGKIVSDWKIEGKQFIIRVEIPVSTNCSLTLPNGERSELKSGKYELKCEL